MDANPFVSFCSKYTRWMIFSLNLCMTNSIFRLVSAVFADIDEKGDLVT